MEQLMSPDMATLLALVAIAAFIAGRVSVGGVSEDERAARRMQERQAAESQFAGLSPSVQGAVDERIRNGKIIEAIKIIRENTGAGLREAKLMVDARRASIGIG